MTHQTGPLWGDKFLEQIASEFSRFREEKGRRYSEELKSMVISAVGMGLSAGSVAKVAGISTTAIRNWTAKVPKGKQLRLVAPAKVVLRSESASTIGLICIRLASGVEIDFPRGELSADFLAILNGIGRVH